MADIAQIQQQIAGLKTQEDLNKFFATSGYTAAELAQAAPQFGDASAYQDAMAKGAQAYAAAQNQPSFGGGGVQAPVNSTATTWANGNPVSAGDLQKYGQGSFNFPTYADGRINTSDPAFTKFMQTATPAEINAASNQWNFNAQQTDRSGGTGAGVGSWSNNLSWMPTDNYANYAAKYNAQSKSGDPTWAWMNGGNAMLTQDQWNAQNTNAAAEKARGVTFGGGSTPASEATAAATAAAYAAAHPLGAAGTANPGSQVNGTGALTQVQPWVNNYQPGNVMQPGQSVGGGAIHQAQPFNWGAQQPQQGGQFNTPVLDALYQGQQQRMTSQAPSFNFQAKPAATTDQPGALTQAITGP